MNETLIVIGAVLGAALVGLFVLSRNYRRPSNVAYALMTLSFVVLLTANLFTYSGIQNDVLILWCIRIVAAATTAVLTCLYFLLQFLSRESRQDRYSRRLNNFVLVASVGVLLLNLTPFVFNSVNFVGQTSSFTVEVLYGSAVFAVHAITILGLSMAHLIKGVAAGNSSRKGRNIAILIGVAPTLFIAPITSFVLPVLYGQTAFVALTPLYVTFFIVMVAYAMIRHGLFDIRLAAVRTAAYVLTLLTLSLIYYGIVYLLSLILFRGQASDTLFSVSPANIAIALLIAFIFQPIKKLFDRLTDKLFYKDNYSIDSFIAELNKTLNSTNDLRSLLHRTATVIAATFKSEQVFFLVETSKGRYVTAGTDGHKRPSTKEFLAVHEEYDDQRIILQAQLEGRSPLRRLMVSYEIQLTMPLYNNGQIIGYLCSGDHKASGYTARDVKALLTVADEITIATQNALSVEEVRKLNATLEQRIDAATKELRASNAQLQKLDEAKDEFISMASHQLRTPLTSIKGYISMLVEGDVGAVTKEQKHLLEQAFSSSERMVRLIGDFLNVSRLQTGKFVIDKKPVNLAALVQSEVDGLESNAATRQLKFVYKRPAHFPDLMIDENKFQQVIMNFSDNAIYYSKENSKIVVTLREVNGMAEFTVKDTGIGVPADQQVQLFGKFFRATNARLQRPDGTGVGLFLAKKVIDAHGGTVVFESKEGRGSTFGFRLPIKKLRA